MTRSLPLLLVLGAGLAACDGVRADAEAPLAVVRRDVGAACGTEEIQPATGAPAEGLWLWEGADHRVAAIVGPPQTEAGRALVTRRIETIEARRGADTLRYASDTATVRLQLLPPFAQPAAAYTVGSLVQLASYEPCSPHLREPLIRYLRHDREGRVMTDVMLSRASAP